MLNPYTLRYVLWLLYNCKEHSNRMIAEIAKCTHPTVAKLRRAMQNLKHSWDELTAKTDSELKQLMYSKPKAPSDKKVEPDYQEALRQLKLPKKYRKTIAVLFDEYRLKYGDRAYGKTVFYQKIRDYLKSKNVVMKQHYLPAEILCIDYAGTKLKYIEHGQTHYLNVFVACLGHSKKIFAYATPDMKSESWISALIKALDYFGGVPDTIQFDNAKAMVKQAGRLALLNHNIQQLSMYYRCFCDTSRVGTPTDNAVAENAVKIVNSVLARMNQDLTLFSASEVNEELLKAVEDNINNKPFQKLDTTRNERFFEHEQPKLKALPAVPYKVILVHKDINVPSTYLVPYKGHEYSVPYGLAHERVSIRVTVDELIVFHDGKEVARHTLNKQQGGFTRLPEHMKPEHLAEERKSLSTFLAWAKDVGEDAENIVRKQYAPFGNDHARKAGKQCLVLQKLCKERGNDAFNKACRLGLSRGLFLPNDIQEIIATKAYEQDFVAPLIAHQHTRGADYYKERRYDN